MAGIHCLCPYFARRPLSSQSKARRKCGPSLFVFLCALLELRAKKTQNDFLCIDHLKLQPGVTEKIQGLLPWAFLWALRELRAKKTKLKKLKVIPEVSTISPFNELLKL